MLSGEKIVFSEPEQKGFNRQWSYLFSLTGHSL